MDASHSERLVDAINKTRKRTAYENAGIQGFLRIQCEGESPRTPVLSPKAVNKWATR